VPVELGNGTKTFRKKFEKVDTPYGGLVAFENFNNGTSLSTTVVPGFYMGELEPKDGYQCMSIEKVSDEKKREISEILKNWDMRSLSRFGKSSNFKISEFY